MDVPDGLRSAAFIFSALIPVGCAHTAWLKSSWSWRLSMPLDFGMTLRGRRLFGANKMLRGVMVIVPGSGLAFLLLSVFLGRPWPLSSLQYAGLGICAGAGFVLGELPNSFVKRQLDIKPGAAPGSVLASWVFALVDRTDSLLGMLFAIRLFVPVPWVAWAVVLGAGVFVHASFSIAMFHLGVKTRRL